MTSKSERAVEDFLEWYAANQAANETAAITLARYVNELLVDANIRTLMVTARAKTIDSVRGKLLRKPYSRPRHQLTDRLGVRVIVYHGREVDAVAMLLRKMLHVNETQSSDKRLVLGLREFGYRSYHLVARLSKGATTSPSLWSLRGQTFEVQIRSLLEHVWAEIEHDVIYKSGADWPPQIRRRFAAIAGVLELLEHEFDQLSDTNHHLIEQALASLRESVDTTRTLDVPFMSAVLENEYPDGLSFSTARLSGNPFPPSVEQRLHLALRRAGIATIGALLRALRSPRVRSSIQRYANAEGIPRSEVSHLALLTLVLGVRSPSTLRIFFPEFAAENSMRAAFARRR